MDLDQSQATLVYRQLMRRFEQSAQLDREARWRWLTAAHIVGQHHFGLHVESHIAMLGFAARNRDIPEVAGQMFRLALVPIGHITGRLPAGNIGRATVSAFTPMPLDALSRELILGARMAVAEQQQDVNSPSEGAQ